jgi:phosphoglycolate phosphatase-like HAD superfamily hydrolase
VLKGIIFDFDGVIAESVQVKTDAFANLYEQYGDNIVTKVIEHHEANGGMSRFKKIKLYHESFLNKTITNKEIVELASQFSKLVIKKVIDSPYVPGVLEYIRQCYKRYKLFISTGTPTEEMNQILEEREIAQYFTQVFGSPEEKILHLQNILSKYDLQPDELIFYGDSNTDMEAAKGKNITFIFRLHTLNKNRFNNYNGKTIIDFNEL